MRNRQQPLRQGSGKDTAVMQTYGLFLPAAAGLAQRPFTLLREEGAESDLIQSPGLRQAVGLLIGLEGRLGLRAEGAIHGARVESQGFQLALRLP